MVIIHNEQIRDFLRRSFQPVPRPQDIQELRALLDRQGTLEFPLLETGLFPAARLTADTQYTGYGNVWVRDNVHIAHAHYATGRVEVACRNAQALLLYFGRHQRRFLEIIRGEADPGDPMNRPHVRFNGQTLAENPEKWSHAQNDALGYFLWFYCTLAQAGHLDPQPEEWEVLGLFPLYFQAIGYWQDEDSGHWEEARKVEASSIGTVVAALREMRRLMAARGMPEVRCEGGAVTLRRLDDLIQHGRTVLHQMLPEECLQPDPAKRRRCDSALLFLIYPLQVVDDAMADQILHNVETHLQGDYGIRRYLGDSFWCADYKALQKPELRTSDVSDDMSARDALLLPGQEAQWCLFDPLLSTIYGRRYQATQDPVSLEKQVYYLSRSLGQLTGHHLDFPEFRCPELYYFDRGCHVPNDVTPLLWTQAHLEMALKQMETAAQIAWHPSEERG